MITAAKVYTHSRHFAEAYSAVMAPMCEEIDMPQTAADILMFLANNPGCDTAKDICKYRHLKPGIVSFHIENLVKQGYIERQSVDGDRRKCRLVCTEKSLSAIETGRKLQAEFINKMTIGLSEDEINCCLHCFEVFEKNLNELTKKRS